MICVRAIATKMSRPCAEGSPKPLKAAETPAFLLLLEH